MSRVRENNERDTVGQRPEREGRCENSKLCRKADYSSPVTCDPSKSSQKRHQPCRSLSMKVGWSFRRTGKSHNQATAWATSCPSLYLTNSRLLYDQVNEQEMFGLVG